MDDLVTFIEARLAEDERAAHEAADGDSGEWFVGRKWNVYKSEDMAPFDEDESNELIVYGNAQAWSEHIARHDPARVLRDVKAKRRTLARHAPHHHGACPTCWRVTERSSTREDFPCPTLLDLAAPYADHPGFRPEWEVVDG